MCRAWVGDDGHHYRPGSAASEFAFSDSFRKKISSTVDR